MPRFSLISNMSELIRRETLDDVDYLVVPVVLIKEGVWNDLLYPADELAKFPEAWNARTVPVYHPSDIEGKRISANDPKTIEAHSVGMLFNVTFDTESAKLKGEVWMDPIKCERSEDGKKVLAKLEGNEMIEVSTGLFVEVLKKEGVFDGKKYQGVAINYRPDHLAVLPDVKGACSNEDGAGMPRVNQAEEGEDEEPEGVMGWLMRTCKRLMGNRDASLDARRKALRSLLEEKYLPNGDNNWLYIEDLREKSVVYVVEEMGKIGTFHSIGYSVDSKGVPTLADGEPTEVKPVTEYRPVSNEQEEGDDEMDREKLISGMISNGAFTEDDKTFLEALSDERLEAMSKLKVEKAPSTAPATNDELTAAAKKGAEEALKSGAAPKVVPKVEPKTNDDKPKTAEDYLADMPPEVAAALRSNMKTNEDKCDALVAALVENKRCHFTKEQLEGYDVDALQNMADMVQVTPNFAGNDPGAAPKTLAKKNVTPMPVWNWKEDKIAEPAVAE